MNILHQIKNTNQVDQTGRLGGGREREIDRERDRERERAGRNREKERGRERGNDKQHTIKG